jgi:hypothetical protein
MIVTLYPKLMGRRRPSQAAGTFRCSTCIQAFGKLISTSLTAKRQPFQYHYWDIMNLPAFLMDCNSPDSFQRLMDLVLRNLIGHGAWEFINDVLIYSDKVEEHPKRLANVFEGLERLICNFNQKRAPLLRTKLHT